MLRSFFGRIIRQYGLSLLALGRSSSPAMDTAAAVPDDVMEGYFAVLAIKGSETKRFIVQLHYLNDPAFLGLLERTKEEYGFKHKGALTIPCHPQELEKILG